MRELPEWAIICSQFLIGAVRDDDEREMTRLLRLPVPQLQQIAVTLAAMVPDDRSPTQLLSWLDPDARVSARVLRPCGTHAAFNRHKKNGEPIDEDCRRGERAFQNRRWRRTRALRAERKAS